MALQTHHGRKGGGPWFVGLTVGGIILVLTALLLAVALWGHVSAPGLI